MFAVRASKTVRMELDHGETDQIRAAEQRRSAGASCSPDLVVDLHVQCGQRVFGSVFTNESWMPFARARRRTAGLCVACARPLDGPRYFREVGALVEVAVESFDASRGARLAAYSAVSTSLALCSDRELRDLVDTAAPMGSGIGGTSALLEVGGTPVFVKP